MTNPRKNIGIIFNFDPKWMGGVIYTLNVIKVFDYLDEETKPMIYVFYKPNLQRFVDEINYPYIEKIIWPYPSVYKQFLKSLLTRKNSFVEGIINQYGLDAIYPLHDFPVKSKLNCNIVPWIADLQQCHYPQFFSVRKRLERYFRIQFILRNATKMVVSSHAVKDDFDRFFKIPKTIRFEVYHFVSIIDKFPTQSFDEIKEKYGLPDHYFIISNQFHKHKNHKVVFKAIAALKEKGIIVNLVLTGKLPDDAKSVYLSELRAILSENELDNQVLFLGVIPRDIQLAIMRYADAVIQPSLFEGWSTVIEDAIALQKPVISSNLPVNVEQLKEKGFYFSAHDFEDLSEALVCRDYTKLPSPLYEAYETRVKRAANKLYKILID